jgi:hypothetical protein
VTKKKKTGDNKKRRNLTAHDRAMTDPQVQEVFRVLQSNWNKLTPPEKGEQGEQLQKLVDSGCSVRGLERNLGEPASNIRRYMAQAKGSDQRSGRIANISTKKPTRQNTLSVLEAARESQAMFQRNRTVGPALKETGWGKKPQGASVAQPTKKMIAGPASVATRVEPVIDDGLGGKENRVEEGQRSKSLIHQWKLGHPDNSERIQLLASMTIEPRPFRDARSMKRQGRPLPPTD